MLSWHRDPTPWKTCCIYQIYMPKKKKIRKRETDLFHSHMKDPNVRNTIARDRERDPCRKKRWKFPRFGFIFLCTLFITTEWLLLVPFYFTLIIPTLIASSSRNPSLDYIFIHYYSSLSLSLSLSAILPFTTSWFFGEVNTVEFVWFLVFWISIYIWSL